MGFDVNEVVESQQFVEVNETLWLAEDRQTVVAEGDPAAAFLLATPGKRLARADAERYGLVKASKQAAPAAEGASADEAPAEKPAAKKSRAKKSS